MIGYNLTLSRKKENFLSTLFAILQEEVRVEVSRKNFVYSLRNPYIFFLCYIVLLQHYSAFYQQFLSSEIFLVHQTVLIY